MLLDYTIYYKKFGIRRLNQLFSPTVWSIDTIRLARNSIYHFYTHDPDILTPDASDLIFKPYTKKILVNHVSELTSKLGAPKHLNKVPKTLVRPWHLQNNSKFRYVDDISGLSVDVMTLVLYNYGILHPLYRYVEMIMTPYHKWFNIEKTVWTNIARVAKESHKQQFVRVKLPTTLPSVGVLKIFSTKTNPQLMKIFDTEERLSLLELWKWIDPETRSTSTMSEIDYEASKYINIILEYQGMYVVLNLSKLEEWRVNNSEITEATNQPTVPVITLQKFMLKLCMSIQSSVPIVDDELTDDDQLVETTPEHVQSLAEVETNLTQAEEIDSLSTMTKNIEADLEVLDKLNTDILEDANDEVSDEPVFTTDSIDVKAEIYEAKSAVELNQRRIEELAESGAITAATYRDLIKQIEKSTTIISPYDDSKTISEYVKIKPEDLTINNQELLPETATVLDKSMTKSTLSSYDKQYVKKVLPKDIVSCVDKLSHAGILIKDYNIEKESSALGQYEIHSVKLKPLDGQESTIYFRMPVVNDEGDFYIGGNKVTMRKQRSDMPIRKINPSSVALSSYYGKVFVNRTERKQFDEMEWLSNHIRQIGMAGGNDVIKKVTTAIVYNNHLQVPRIYSSLGMGFKYIQTTNYKLMFDYQERSELFSEKDLSMLETQSRVVCGMTTRKEPIVVDQNNVFYIYRDNEYISIGNIYQVLNIDTEKTPIQFSELKVFSKSIPLAVVLGYYIGITKTISLANAKPKIIASKTRYTPASNEWIMRFSDYKLVFDKNNTAATLLLSGMLFYKDTLKQFKYSDFDKHHVYMNVLDQRGIPARYLKELDNLKSLFVDPITQEILKDMQEPQTFLGLLVRSNELLLTDWHPDSNDLRYMRIKGYERMAGMMYKELVGAVREYQSKNIRGKSQINLAPYAVWRTITQDQTVKMCEDINPVTDLKEVEAVTYVGGDGRSKDAMNKQAREFHVTDMGVISEATVDSGDVSINTYMTHNPQLTTVRGVSKPYDPKTDGKSTILSTSALLAPGATYDDHKRVNFINIQNAHTVACQGYHQPYLRTGYENVVPARVGKLYAYIAQDEGRVVELTDSIIVVEYKSKERVGIQIGRQYGRAEGSIYPHDISTPLKLNAKFNKGDPIAYNTNFFEPDMLNPKQIIMKTHTVGRVALMESTQTIEDASSLSPKISQLLQTRVVKERTFVVNFKQNIRNAIPANTPVSPKDILFIIEDEITSDTDIFDSDTIESLSRLSNLAPKAKVVGTLDRYEVYYNGDIEDMSPTLRKLTQQSNKQFQSRTAGTDFMIKDGRVTEEYRVEGKALQLDTAVIKVYIVVKDNCQLGDKVVFANQMKSVVCEVLHYPVKTETGLEIDAIFSYKSFNNRIVNSPQIIGTTTTLLKKIAEKAVAVYRK